MDRGSGPTGSQPRTKWPERRAPPTGRRRSGRGSAAARQLRSCRHVQLDQPAAAVGAAAGGAAGPLGAGAHRGQAVPAARARQRPPVPGGGRWAARAWARAVLYGQGGVSGLVAHGDCRGGARRIPGDVGQRLLGAAVERPVRLGGQRPGGPSITRLTVVPVSRRKPSTSSGSWVTDGSRSPRSAPTACRAWV